MTEPATRPRFGQVLFGAVAALSAVGALLPGYGIRVTKSTDIGVIVGLPLMVLGALAYLAALALTGYGLAVYLLGKRPPELGRWPVYSLWAVLAAPGASLLTALLGPLGILLLLGLVVYISWRRKSGTATELKTE